MSSLIAVLEQQHQDVLARIAAAQGRFDAPTASDFVAYLEDDVLAHFALEEELLFPEMAQHPALAQGPLRVMHAEHAAFRELLAAARAARSARDGEHLGAAAADLAALLEAHIAKEDRVLFPLARQRLSTEQLRRIDDAARQASRATRIG